MLKRFLVFCVAAVTFPLSSSVADPVPPSPEADGFGRTIVDAQTVTFTELETVYLRQIERIRRAMVFYHFPELPLFDKANAAFTDYLKIGCVDLISKWYEGGSAARTGPALCYMDAYLGRLRTLCGVFSTFLPHENGNPAYDDRCEVRDNESRDEEIQK